MDLFRIEACAVCDGRVSLKTLFGDETGFLCRNVGEERNYVKTDKNVRLAELQVFDDSDELAGVGDVVRREAY